MTFSQAIQNGMEHFQAGRLLHAEAIFRQILANDAENLTALHILACIYHRLGKPQQSLEFFNRAIHLSPDNCTIHFNHGVALQEQDRYEDALESYGRAIVLKPDYVDAYLNRGKVLRELKCYEEAMLNYDRATVINPDHADVQLNKAILMLLIGNYEEGWPLYEWRWKTQQLRRTARKFSAPQWLGNQPLANRTILLHAEQGLGDAIQFLRYVPKVEALGATVIVELPSSLVPLVTASGAAFKTVANGDPLPAFDLHCPMMSLPMAFKTTIASIPAEIPYLFVDERKQLEWRGRLGSKSRLRIGLVWSGSASHLNDRNRSIALALLEPILRLDCEFHSLQKEVNKADREVLSRLDQMRLHEDQLFDFADTAALIAEMDLVISVDTAAAHLAGALGKEVWILLQYSPDFRWLADGIESPWYPNARLFRQSSDGDWSAVIGEVCAALQARLTAL